jgi:ribonuclease VapC
MSSPVILDASALLAVLFQEKGAKEVERHIGSAEMSSVNVAEVVSKLVDKGLTDEEATEVFAALKLPVRPFSEGAALETARLRRLSRQSGLSLGDRACLAEASVCGGSVVTADRLWATLPLETPIEVIR